MYFIKDSVSFVLDYKFLKFVFLNCSRFLKFFEQYRRYYVNFFFFFYYLIYFQFGFDQSDENLDDNDNDGDLGFELLGFCYDEEGYDNENNQVNINFS